MGLLPSNTSQPCSSPRHPKAEPAGHTPASHCGSHTLPTDPGATLPFLLPSLVFKLFKVSVGRGCGGASVRWGLAASLCCSCICGLVSCPSWFGAGSPILNYNIPFS